MIDKPPPCAASISSQRSREPGDTDRRFRADAGETLKTATRTQRIE
jgi:hypothetical protein